MASTRLDGRRHRCRARSNSRATSSGYFVPRACASARPDQVVRRHLREERLGRRDPDLGPGVGVQHGVGLPGDLRHRWCCTPRAPWPSARLACRTASSVSAVSPGLGDGDDQRVPVEHRVAVAELTGQLDLDREPGPVLDGVLGDQAGVVGGAAGHDEHLVDVAQVLVGQTLLVEHDAPALEVSAQRVGERVGLLLDLLVHEVLVAALLRGRQVPVDREGLALRGATVEVGDLIAVAGDHHELVLAELDGLAGVLDERGDVGGDEDLASPDTHHQR